MLQSICGINASRILRLFLHHYILFYLAQCFVCGNSRYLFPKHWNWQICHIHWAFKLPLLTFSGNLRTLPMMKSKTIFSYWTPTVHSNTFLVNFCMGYSWEQSCYYFAFSVVAGTCYPTWCTWLNWNTFENCSKCLAEQVLVLQTVWITSSFGRTRWEQSEHCCKKQYEPKRTLGTN